ncbi:anthranilate synthase family protein [Kineosporia sp. NBRC 101731]|uniref:anthranilate synthase family protein n=1 Tax=Kineosporia sp. NBRC 101731 TaxID=3032199 RepID=UPI0024A4462A|nr:anthranilate synthase family protein [Kineosporia sp. NBRC 101731]GLY32342.1 phenazine-specific anthranilate synthase component I [Kineosporia sp. NBRC 101731]
MSDLLDTVLADTGSPFALLHRPGGHPAGAGVLEVLTGSFSGHERLAEVPQAPRVLVLVPFRQVTERGFTALEDDAQLLAMPVQGYAEVDLDMALRRLPDQPVKLRRAGFDTDDESYRHLVASVLKNEIGAGEGANFVIKRSFEADLEGYSPAQALSFFRRLLENEKGSYWTFLVHTGDRTLVGASPEQHVALRHGTVSMNPISGTYRYPRSGPSLEGLLHFLGDRKETEELYMVLDEELKMMARICPGGGRVAGPFLREMAQLAHTEYLIHGHSNGDPRDILRETLLAPTVTGSPLQNACEVIARYETRGRGYYSGVLGLIEREPDGAAALDSTILIRTSDIDASGHLRLDVGATLVRHSDPDAEVAETVAKAAGPLAALDGRPAQRFSAHPSVTSALAGRNSDIAAFWLSGAAPEEHIGSLSGARVLVIDAEDTFTAMLAQQLRFLGLEVDLVPHHRAAPLDAHDLVILGPGPGDPRDRTDARIGRLHEATEHLLTARRPFLAVCLSHQVLGLGLGLPVRRRDTPSQGLQRHVEVFGRAEKVGFYNAFAVFSDHAAFTHRQAGPVRVDRDTVTGEVHAMQGELFASMQFHPESVLTRDGVRILGSVVGRLLDRMPSQGGVR